jgi:hypothetical protein
MLEVRAGVLPEPAVPLELILGALPEIAEPLELSPKPSKSSGTEEERLPVNEGRSLKFRMTLPRGARSSPIGGGIVLVEVRFFRIAIFILPF